MQPGRMLGPWILFLISLGIPPLLLVSVPLLVWSTISFARRAAFLMRSRDHYVEERALIQTAKLWRTGR